MRTPSGEAEPHRVAAHSVCRRQHTWSRRLKFTPYSKMRLIIVYLAVASATAFDLRGRREYRIVFGISVAFMSCPMERTSGEKSLFFSQW
ncbi:hypothetical protein Hamer_G004296 [Homarus americanus]|uniref:Uncharacterized protein n=1 Tax=Homarus americanus TaxID=6706 RepID=A0A8J5MQ35_HOMAM|nr:hypothetical protein Hamer_G004296 [Homarus americanus]